jgi:DNA-binding LacI/PurR family transcriptional regulator
MKKNFVSAQDVATLAGVSRSAVSRAFTQGASISGETRHRVLTAATTLGYQVNHLARGLMVDRSGIVCLIVTEMDTPYRARMVRLLTQALQDAGSVAMVINTDRSDESVTKALQQTMAYRADASILLSGLPDRSIVQRCLDNGQRIVLINRDDPMEGPHRINLDDAGAARQGLNAFLAAGCRRLAFANSAVGTPSLMAREAGFVAAAHEQGLSVAVARHGATLYPSGMALAHDLLTRVDRPDAIFCVTDLIACGVMDVARQQYGLRIPEDLSIIGFDDIEQAGWGAYELTTFAQPLEAIAIATVAALADDTAAAPVDLRMQAPLIWRGSVRIAQAARR